MQTYTVKISEDGTFWYNEAGRLHRENGPAIELASGWKEYWINGQLHRENDLPAVEYADGEKVYYLNGKLHRENGPAFEGADEDKQYWINGEKLTEEEFNNRNRPLVGTKIIINGVEYTLS